MIPSVLSDMTYEAAQSTIDTSVVFAEFKTRFEKAVPQVMGNVSVLATHFRSNPKVPVVEPSNDMTLFSTCMNRNSDVRSAKA